MTKTRHTISTAAIMLAAMLAAFAPTSAQTVPKQGAQSTPKPKPTPPPAPAANYTIGPNDVLTVIVWRAPELSGDVRVRPDGKITLAAGNDIQAAGLTTEQLKASVIAEVKKCCYADPDVIIQAKEILSRIVYIQGEGIAKPGAYPLSGPMSIVQAVTIAGGFTEFAHKKEMILISGSLKNKDGSQFSWKINYELIEKGKGSDLSKYNVQLSPGDTLIVK